MNPLHELLGRALYALAWIAGRLPLPAQRALGAWAGSVMHRLDRRASRVARRNLEIIQPGWTPEQREAEVVRILRATGSNALETIRIWTRSRADNLALVRAVHGEALLADALAQGRGLILAAPHFGNWELLIEYMASRGPFSLVYRVPEKRFGDVFLRLARGGENVQLVPAETNAMRPLFRALKAGETVGITPDQQPKLGAGEFAPFFGRQSLTLSLIPKLAARSGAPVVFAYAEPVPGGFDIHIEPAMATIASDDLVLATTAMNAQVEAIARRDLCQYQWTYKRFSKRPPGSGETNPYRPDCY
jgi:Kdo2-lipid IVA lauroyltransferase/acyltransferase